MLSRRDFFTVGQKKIPNNKAEQADILIYVFQRGAADGLNLIVPYGDNDYYINRPTIAIPAPGNGVNSALDLDGFFGLNPALSSLLPIYDVGDLAMVHACGTTEGSHSHFKNQAFIDRGTVDNNFSTGWLSRYVNSYANTDESAFKSVAMSAAIPPSLAGAEAVVALESIEGFNIIAPESEAQSMNNQLISLFAGEQSLDKVAQATFSAVDLVASIDVNDFPVENDAQYPQSSFGNRLRDLAILIKSDIGIETASIDIGGWDTHDSQAQTLDSLATDYADSMAAFYNDMGDAIANISVITITEFGRRATENGSAGTDHGTGNVAFVMGGGVNGGQVYSNWPGLGPTELYGIGDLAPTTDYRTIISECLDKRLFYTDNQTVFPDFELPNYLDLFIEKA
jgi:uncharacterized protein (DUF1501 family)